MAKITIIGWYGTETIGDRAILAGLLSIFEELWKTLDIRIGSLFPVLSERTLMEDYSFFNLCAGGNLQISIFNSREIKSLKQAIRSSDLLVMGGGPLMDVEEMHLIEYAFREAKKLQVKALLLGCGWGPLQASNKITAAQNAILSSDGVVFRDNISLQQAQKYLGKGSSKFFAAVDPAFFACKKYLESHHAENRQGKEIAVNFRDVASLYSFGKNYLKIFLKEIRKIATLGLTVRLVPMHTFMVGYDDRYILNYLKEAADCPNVVVQNVPLSLEQTMSVYYHAFFGVGVRFHSVVLQSCLNGCNYIIDYTDSDTGKIGNMLKHLGLTEFVRDRYFSLSTMKEPEFNYSRQLDRLKIPQNVYMENKRIYINLLKRTMNDIPL